MNNKSDYPFIGEISATGERFNYKRISNKKSAYNPSTGMRTVKSVETIETPDLLNFKKDIKIFLISENKVFKIQSTEEILYNMKQLQFMPYEQCDKFTRMELE